MTDSTTTSESTTTAAQNQPVRRPVGYVELVRQNANFRWLWFGQIISLLGDWFNVIASAALIATLTDSGLAIGGLLVVRMLAPFAVGPVAGVVADRFNRLRILILTDIGRGIVVLGFLLVRDAGDVWLLYAVSAVQLGLSGFFLPARNAILPDVVGRNELGTANALTATTWSVMLAFGAALGGIVAGSWGTDLAFLIDSLTFFLSAACLLHVAYTFTPKTTAASVRAAVADYVAGLRYLFGHVDILVIVMHKAMSALIISGPFDVLQIRMTEDVFVYGENGGTGLGIMFAMIGVGTGVGPILARRFTGDRDRQQRMALALAYVLAAVGLVIIAPLANFGMVLAGTLLRGAGAGILWVFSTQLLLQLLPDSVRGRVFASEFLLFTLFYSAGATATGSVLETSVLGLGGVLWVMAGAILVPGAWWTWWFARRKQDLAAPSV